MKIFSFVLYTHAHTYIYIYFPLTYIHIYLLSQILFPYDPCYRYSFVESIFQLRALGAEEMIKELIHYLHVAESLSSRSELSVGTPIYNTVLHSLVGAKEVGTLKPCFLFHLPLHNKNNFVKWFVTSLIPV